MLGNTLHHICVTLLVSMSSLVLCNESDYEEPEPISEELPKFNLHSSDLADIITTIHFVDKSLFIKTFVDDNGVVVITAPHHFGKSTNMNMLKRFLEIEVDDDGRKKTKAKNFNDPVRDTENYNLFVKNKLKITENQTFMDKHFGKHPVITVNFEFNIVHVMNYDIALDHVKYIIHSSYVEHEYLKKSDRINTDEKIIVRKWCSPTGHREMSELDIAESLRLLSRMLYRQYENRRPYVLVDNVDSPAMNALLFAETDGVMGGIYRLQSTLLIRVLQKNFHAHRGLLTGVSYIATSPALFSLGYVGVCRYLENHAYSEFYGLTKDEVGELLSRDAFNLTKVFAGQVRDRYGGYQSCGNVSLHNMWSVLNALHTRMIRDHWTDPGIVFNMETLLRIPVVKKEVDHLAKGKIRQVLTKKIYAPEDVIRLRDLVKSPELHRELHRADLVMSFLLELGYLTYLSELQPFLGKKRVKIPNREIRNIFYKTIKKYMHLYGAENTETRQSVH